MTKNDPTAPDSEDQVMSVPTPSGMSNKNVSADAALQSDAATATPTAVNPWFIFYSLSHSQFSTSIPRRVRLLKVALRRPAVNSTLDFVAESDSALSPLVCYRVSYRGPCTRTRTRW